MTREPHIHTPAHDPGRPNMGSADWWRRHMPKEPDWWPRVFSQPFGATDASKTETSLAPNRGDLLTNACKSLRQPHG